MVGVYVTTLVGAQLVFNLPWGRVSDRRDNRTVLRLLSVGRGVTTVLALILVGTVALLQPYGPWLPYLVLPLFVLDGAMRPAEILSGSNYLLELIPDTERSIYLGLSNTLSGIAVLVSGLSGLVVDALGFIGPFVISLGLYLVTYAFATRLPEARDM